MYVQKADGESYADIKWTVSYEIGRMTQRMEPGLQKQSQDSQKAIFQGAEIVF